MKNAIPAKSDLTMNVPSFAHLYSPVSVEWRHPVIKFNSKVVETSEVLVRLGSHLDLQCQGDGAVNWQTRLPKHRRFVSKSPGNVRSIKVERPTAEFTGTYKCYYTGGSKYRNLTSSVHVYVKGEWRGGEWVTVLTVLSRSHCLHVLLHQIRTTCSGAAVIL